MGSRSDDAPTGITFGLTIRPAAPRPRFHPESAGFQRIGGLVEVPALLQELGADPCEVFESVGLQVADFETADAQTSYVNIGRLLGACAAATKREHFGLLAGMRWRLGHLGIVGELMRSASTVGESLRIGAAHQWLNASGGVSFVFERDGMAEVGYGVYLGGVPHVEQIHDLALALQARLIRDFCCAAWKPSSVHLPRAMPADVAPYTRFFGTSVQFGADHAALHFPDDILAYEPPDANPVRKAKLERALNEIAREELVPRLRRAIRVMLAFGDTSADSVAARLSMHRRTFDRRLAACGTSYQAVLNDVRYAVARQMLESTSLRLSEIAGALGFAESSSFVRAFGRWSGTTPTGWRRSEVSQRVPGL
ncbi:MAG TPA: AraC family transcriptional regulator [Burkholderiaceae bacterium]|nr:AraC family transcriptional regulator [Burkholderiaceae bacterium]HQR70807.1 AraC family transcriptional regulator [Burkholderiaceae bacterium]